jgi:hypothetical protein
VQQFVALLELDEHDHWFQQDGATSHTVNETTNVLWDIFGDCLISKKHMAAMFPCDLTMPNFFLSCHSKERAYKDNFCTQNDFKVAIWQEIKQMSLLQF